MFQENLGNTITYLEESLGCILIGFDGIPIAHTFRDDEYGFEKLMPLTIELSNALSHLNHMESLREVGGMRELTLQSDGVVLVVRAVLDEYILILAVEPSCDLTKARRMLRLVTPWVERLM